MKDVLKCLMTASGEQCVMMDSLTRRHELFAICSDFGTFKLGHLFLRELSMVLVCSCFYGETAASDETPLIYS